MRVGTPAGAKSPSAVRRRPLALRRLLISAAARCAVGFGTPRLSVLIFHRVLDKPDPLRASEPDAKRFAQIIDWIATRFTPLSLPEGVERLQNGTLPDGAVCLTFDDGYEDNLTVAAPICRRRAVPFTLFVASGYLDGGIMWNDLVIESVRRAQAEFIDLTDMGYGRHPVPDNQARAALIDSLLSSWKYLPFARREHLAREVAARYAPKIPSPMLSSEQVRRLASDGIEIGGHTLSHPILTLTEDSTAMHEIAQNKRDLEGLLGRSLTFFAYPNGAPQKDFTDAHARMVRSAGYAAALTTESGVSCPTTDPFRLPRFTPWDRSALRFSVRLLLNARHPR
jgi:peptidoglycan/xylan/chitin deacetylase (PgdA/CDA1 family)